MAADTEVRPAPAAGDDGSRGGRSRKSAKAFRTISEVSEILDVPQHVLRFWETKFSQIRPLKRGGGRRYYRPEDITLLRGVRDLLYDDGYTIKGVQKLLREGGVKVLQERAGASPSEAPAKAAGAEPRLADILAELEDVVRALRAALDE